MVNPFHPTSASWHNQFERFFLDHPRRKIHRGVFTSIADLEAPILRYFEAHNKKAKPFDWTASAASVFEKLAEIPEPSE